jgi:hypothetical protein
MDQLSRVVGDGQLLCDDRTTSQGRLRGAAVVGLGYWGPNWVRNLYHLQCADRVVACDLDEGRRKHVQMLYPGVESSSRFEGACR